MRGASGAATGCCSLRNGIHGFRCGAGAHLKQVHNGFDQSGVERFDDVLQSVRPAALFSMCVWFLFWKSSTQSANLLAETAGLGAEEKNVVSNAHVHPRCSRVRGQRDTKRDCNFSGASWREQRAHRFHGAARRRRPPPNTGQVRLLVAAAGCCTATATSERRRLGVCGTRLNHD
jgi:hypothetical protein